MACIHGTVSSFALPRILDSLGAAAADSQWIVESYALFLSALILVGGSLRDYFSRWPRSTTRAKRTGQPEDETVPA
jgi:hypothetical protein